MQIVFVYIIIVCSLGYAGRLVYKALSRKNSPCEGCRGCVLRDKKRFDKKRGCKDRSVDDSDKR